MANAAEVRNAVATTYAWVFGSSRIAAGGALPWCLAADPLCAISRSGTSPWWVYARRMKKTGTFDVMNSAGGNEG